MNIKEFLEPKGYTVTQQVNFGNELLIEKFGNWGAMESAGTINGVTFKLYDHVCVFQVNNEFLVCLYLDNETLRYTDIYKETRTTKEKRVFKNLMLEFAGISNFKYIK